MSESKRGAGELSEIISAGHLRLRMDPSNISTESLINSLLLCPQSLSVYSCIPLSLSPFSVFLSYPSLLSAMLTSVWEVKEGNTDSLKSLSYTSVTPQ